MAHRIIGIDVGYRSVKAAVIDKALRKTALVALEREDIGVPGDGEAIKAALGKLLSRTRVGGDDVVMAGLPSAPCVRRILRFPFTDAASIEESVGFELETHIPLDIEELIIDHVAVGETDDGETDVYTVAAPSEVVSERLELFRAVGAEPRSLGLASLSYATLLGNMESTAEGTSMVLDVGATSTEMIVVRDGEVKFARSLSVGSDAVRETFSSKFETEGVEEDLLQTHCLILPPAVPPSNPSEQVLHAATIDALTPWLRELRISVAAASRGSQLKPDRIILTGGMAGMRGLHDYLERLLRAPVTGLNLTELEIAQMASADGDRFGLATALALQGTELRTQDSLDFRKGDLAYEGDFKFLQQRVPQIAAFVIIALCLLGVQTTINYRALVHEYERQKVQLHKLSKVLTQKKFRKYSKLKTEMKRGLKVDLAEYYPDMSAIKVFEEMSVIIGAVTEPPDFQGKMPDPMARKPGGPRGAPTPGAVGIRATFGKKKGGSGGEQADAGDDGGEEETKVFDGHKVELLSTDIDRTKVSLRGDCDTQDALLAFQEKIERHSCFHKVKSSSDRITFERHKGWFRFTIRFEIRCPEDTPTTRGKKGKNGKKGKKGKGGKR